MTLRGDGGALDAAYAECRAVAKREARNFYYAFLALPPRRRRAIHAAYAFSRLADDIADGPGDAPAKRAELAALRERLRAAFAGRPDAPVFAALADAARAYAIDEALFQDVISGVEMDLAPRRFADFGELKRYCYHVASVVGLISIRVFGCRGGPAAEESAVDFGIAMQLTNILRDLREDAERGRVYQPLDEMARRGYSEDDLRRGEVNAAFRALMEEQAARARRYFASGARLLPLVEPESRPCAEGLLRLYSGLLDRMEARGWDVFSRRASLSTAEKLALVCKLWTGAKLRRALGR